MIKDIYTYILEFEGIIGALLGVIITMIMTKLLQNSGRIKVDVVTKKLITSKYDDYGVLTEVLLSEADYLNIEFTVDFYNTSDSPKHLNNFNISFFGENNDLLGTTEIKDKSTGRSSSVYMVYDDFDHINISPKSLIKMDLKLSISLEEVDVRSYKKIVFTYENHNKKKHSLVLY